MPSTPIDHVLALVIALVYPLYWKITWHRRGRAQLLADTTVRIGAYREVMRTEWFLAALIAACWFLAERSAAVLGLGAPGGWPFWAGVVLFVAYVVLGVRQIAGLGTSADARAKIRGQMHGDVALLIPKTLPERRVFAALSLTAGICEEIAYRGFMLWYLATLLPIAAAVAVSAVIFGFAHIYLGWSHVLRTGLVGLVLGVVYILTGSLWVPIALHAAMDIVSGFAGFAAYAETPAGTGTENAHR